MHISVKKFQALSLKSQVRWLLLGLQDVPDSSFYSQYLEPIIVANTALGPALQREWERFCSFGETLELEHLLRQLCGLEPSDWCSEAEGMEALGAKPYPLYLYLDRVRSPFNVGSVFRSAAALGVKQLWLHEYCPSLDHPRALRSAMGAIELLPAVRCNEPWREPQLCELPWLGLETPDIAGGCSLAELAFPPQGGLLLIGAEDTGLRPELLEYCSSSENRQRGGTVLSIPMSGLKSSLNLGVATAIVLQRWTEAIP